MKTQFQFTYPWSKPVHWGLLSSCRNAKKMDENKNILYEGSWFKVRQYDYGIIYAIITHGIEWVTECAQKCTDGWCLMVNCDLLRYNVEFGACYPKRCSPAEIIIATRNTSYIENTHVAPFGVYGTAGMGGENPNILKLIFIPCPITR